MRSIDFQLTLIESAQVFHWRAFGDTYAAVVDGRILTSADNSPEAAFYFDDQRDYSLIADECGCFEKAAEAVRLLPGLKVLNQPAWEALVAFILSANNNVKRIRNLVFSLCEKYGKPFEYNGNILYGFPQPDVLARLDPAKLKIEVTMGYRAEYLVETARMIEDGFDLEALRNTETEEARKRIMQLKGVGPKVADCVLLFGLGHADAFPVDVWVARLMESWFGVNGSREHMCAEARRLLGPHCGLIQQALFHAARTGKIEL
ncbi:MAG: DNA-3-methyladenine glycosylase 2 family protein [Clostridia bacterium]|nr:DNA-3-methyladenine glycosylase 2 family protein [Clostridia bacterium]